MIRSKPAWRPAIASIGRTSAPVDAEPVVAPADDIAAVTDQMAALRLRELQDLAAQKREQAVAKAAAKAEEPVKCGYPTKKKGNKKKGNKKLPL